MVITTICWLLLDIGYFLLVVRLLLLRPPILTFSIMLWPLVPPIALIIISIWVGYLITTLVAALTLADIILIWVTVLTIVPNQGETIWVAIPSTVVTRTVMPNTIVVIPIRLMVLVIPVTTIIYPWWITPIIMSGWSWWGARPIINMAYTWTIATVGMKQSYYYCNLG